MVYRKGEQRKIAAPFFVRTSSECISSEYTDTKKADITHDVCLSHSSVPSKPNTDYRSISLHKHYNDVKDKLPTD